MTLEDTRRLGIEFERRVQTMIPEKELLEKLDTDTIYSYLNQYQDKYIHEIYRNIDGIPSGSKLQTHVDSVLQPLISSDIINIQDKENSDVINNLGSITDSNGIEIIDCARSVIYPLPDDFYMYLKSVSKVTKTYSFRAGSEAKDTNIKILPNQLLSQNDLWNVIETPHDSLRILRYPIACLTEVLSNTNKKTLTVIYDQYTEPTGIRVTYYRQPKRFDIMTSTACELPIDAFEELVSGAVDLYVQYVAGAEARKKQLERARQQAAEEQERRNKKDED